MSSPDAKVTWYLEHVEVAVKDATEEVLKKLALRITERAQGHIRENNQVDTGFLINSVYPVFEGGSGYSEAEAEARTHTHSRKTGEEVDHSEDMAPEEHLESGAMAAVVVGANYAIYQENKIPFLYPAAEEAAGEFGGEATAIYKEQIPDEGPKQ